MTLTIPTWLLWTIGLLVGIPLGLIIIGLLIIGIVFVATFRPPNF